MLLRSTTREIKSLYIGLLGFHISRQLIVSFFTTVIITISAFGQPIPKMEIGTNFWDVGWGGERNDPFVTGYKNVTGENPWKPEFLAEIKIYKVFRFMD